MTNVLVYIECNNNKIEKVSKEIISHLQTKYEDIQIDGILICNTETFDSIKDDVYSLGLDNLYYTNDNIFSDFDCIIYSKVLTEFITNTNYDIFLMGATDNGRNLAPRTASALELGLTADCTELEIDNYGNLFATRPTYGGKMMATIASKTKPNFATIRVGTFKAGNFRQNKTRVSYIDIENNNITSPVEVLENYIKEDNNDLTFSEIIVAGGLGLKTKENFAMIYKLADLLNAKPAAIRAAVEQNWADKSIQIGQTGLTVNPKLYIAFTSPIFSPFEFLASKPIRSV